MSIEQAIVTLITGLPPVEALVGDRVAPAVMPQQLARPNVVYQLIGVRRSYSNDGPTGLKRGTLQVSCYADDYATAKQLTGAIGARVDDDPPGLDGYAGTVGGVEIQSLLIDDERDAPEPPEGGEGAGVSGAMIVFAIAFSG